MTEYRAKMRFFKVNYYNRANHQPGFKWIKAYTIASAISKFNFHKSNINNYVTSCWGSYPTNPTNPKEEEEREQSMTYGHQQEVRTQIKEITLRKVITVNIDPANKTKVGSTKESITLDASATIWRAYSDRYWSSDDIKDKHLEVAEVVDNILRTELRKLGKDIKDAPVQVQYYNRYGL